MESKKGRQIEDRDRKQMERQIDCLTDRKWMSVIEKKIKKQRRIISRYLGKGCREEGREKKSKVNMAKEKEKKKKGRKKNR